MSTAPTDRQADILAFIAGRIASGLPPTVREIGKRFGIRSTNGVADHLKSLERKGLLIVEPVKSRAMWLTPAGAEQTGVVLREATALESAALAYFKELAFLDGDTDGAFHALELAVEAFKDGRR